jgi:predicted transcriptional regulator
MEIYNDILSAINLELTNGEAKPTRVQTLSNLAYDKLVRYLNELEAKKMIMQNPLQITEKGPALLTIYISNNVYKLRLEDILVGRSKRA